MKKAKIRAKLEISDHDGYCSGEECEYEIKNVSHIVDLPDQYKSYPEGKIKNIDEFTIDWKKLLPEPELNNHGSYYCRVSNECEAHGLEQHDYKYTIQSIEIVNSNCPNKNND